MRNSIARAFFFIKLFVENLDNDKTLTNKRFSLLKIRLGVTNKDLAYRFRINYGMVSKIYCSWLVILSKALQPLIVWPSRGALRQHLPSAFKSCKNCACIIDCTEIFIERPLNLEARAIAWSNYKHKNTIQIFDWN